AAIRPPGLAGRNKSEPATPAAVTVRNDLLERSADSTRSSLCDSCIWILHCNDGGGRHNALAKLQGNHIKALRKAQRNQKLPCHLQRSLDRRRADVKVSGD